MEGLEWISRWKCLDDKVRKREKNSKLIIRLPAEASNIISFWCNKEVETETVVSIDNVKCMQVLFGDVGSQSVPEEPIYMRASLGGRNNCGGSQRHPWMSRECNHGRLVTGGAEVRGCAAVIKAKQIIIAWR